MNRIPSHRLQRGVSLIEVLVAVLIFTIGLVGLGGLLITATRANTTAYIRTQVTFLASNMADRMRANPVGLWNANYDSNSYPISGKTVPTCDATTGCTPANVALRDQLLWSQQLTAALPAVGTTSIKCVKAANDPTAQYAMRPPYSGTCTMSITWAERGFAGGDDRVDSGNLQSFTWVFEP
ncbi:type IV pilus modification protein PilV [Luteibacter anthropi]|uniref:Type IV pilus modification protein PilV n=1 Tax=Luteibacter anthropi TaxID=564369 RepID=A0A7X5ZJF7_9GAMM|nr:type IV pilus modification protein PilV [Luteibacter anthropi]